MSDKITLQVWNSNLTEQVGFVKAVKGDGSVAVTTNRKYAKKYSTVDEVHYDMDLAYMNIVDRGYTLIYQ